MRYILWEIGLAVMIGGLGLPDGSSSLPSPMIIMKEKESNII